MRSITDAQLLDFAELISRIPHFEERVLITEAVDCYSAGIFRSAIIMAWVSAAEVLERRLKEIAREDGVAQKRLKIIEAAKAQKNSIEAELITSFGPSKGCLQILDEFEIKDLEFVREIRNNCAHVTGFRPTAEHARFAIRSVIEAVLCKPIKRGHGYKIQLLNLVRSGNPYTLQEPDRLRIREHVQELRTGLIPEFLKDCFGEFNENSDEKVKKVALVFASESLSVLGSKLDSSVKELLTYFLEMNSTDAVELLASIPNWPPIPPEVKSKVITVLQSLLCRNFELPLKDITNCTIVIERYTLDFSSLDIVTLKNLIILKDENNLGGLKNLARCFPEQVSKILVENIPRSNNNTFNIQLDEDLRHVLELVPIIGFPSFSQGFYQGRWLRDYSIAIVRHHHETKGLSTLIKEMQQLPDMLLKYLLTEIVQFIAVNLSQQFDEPPLNEKDFADSQVDYNTLPEYFLHFLDAWTHRGQDLPSGCSDIFHTPPQEFSTESCTRLLHRIVDNLKKANHHANANVVLNVISAGIGF